ncbi:MAG: hypothetical protein ACRDTD_04595 [Pseudonocardiaceae bacterium]
MRFDVSHRGFCEAAEQWLASLDDATICDVRAVFAVSPGYYPTTLHGLWRKEIERRGLTAASDGTSRSGRSTGLPVGHPQDYDWRFTSAAAENLVRLAVEPLASGACLAHVGTPSTYLVGIERYGARRHVLRERSAVIVAAVTTRTHAPHEVMCVDVAEAKLPPFGADAAILDPPWYAADTLAFLAAASRICRDGGRLWLCQPTLATRPGVAAERAAVLQELTSFGLALEAVQAGAVRYKTPHFEAMSLRLNGTDLVAPHDWRVGDLLLLRKMASPHMPTLSRLDGAPWHEACFGPVRIKLRATDAGHDLAPLVPGDVLDTVSRRDPVRSRVGFWTSGNRVYELADPARIGSLIELCSSDLDAMQFTLSRTLDHAQRLGMSASIASRLFDVLLVELQEHTAFEESA